MKKTKIFLLKYVNVMLAVFVLLLGSPNAALADETQSQTDQYDAYICDEAGLLSSEEVIELIAQMEKMTVYGNMMFTTVTLTDSDYEKYGQDAYYEKFGNEPGVNFQIDMGNRKLSLICSTQLNDELASERDTIVDNVYTYATDGDYAACALECFEEIYKVLHDEQIAHKMKYINNAIIALILGLMLNFILVFAATRGGNSESYREKAAQVQLSISSVSRRNKKKTKKYSPPSSSSDSGGGGGSSSGGGGGGGGFSGGSSSHGF